MPGVVVYLESLLLPDIQAIAVSDEVPTMKVMKHLSVTDAVCMPHRWTDL